jgi:hypothetical protein
MRVTFIKQTVKLKIVFRCDFLVAQSTQLKATTGCSFHGTDSCGTQPTNSKTKLRGDTLIKETTAFTYPFSNSSMPAIVVPPGEQTVETRFGSKYGKQRTR